MSDDTENLLDEDELLGELSDEEAEEQALNLLCGLPLEDFLSAASPEDHRDALAYFGMTKIGVAALEVLGSDVLQGPEDVSELALILIECVIKAARESDGHRHKLAAGLRGLARDL